MSLPPISTTLYLHDQSIDQIRDQITDKFAPQMARRLKAHEGRLHHVNVLFHIVKDMTHPYGDVVSVSERPLI